MCTHTSTNSHNYNYKYNYTLSTRMIYLKGLSVLYFIYARIVVSGWLQRRLPSRMSASCGRLRHDDRLRTMGWSNPLLGSRSSATTKSGRRVGGDPALQLGVIVVQTKRDHDRRFSEGP